ncbi:IS3 family transposase [Entomomonas moraniae]
MLRYIKAYYNRARRHSRLNYLLSVEFRNK